MPESDAQDIYVKGGWVLRDGTILPQTSNHTEMAKQLGYPDYWSLCRDGAIAVLRAPINAYGRSSLLFLRVHALDPDTKSRLRDFILFLPTASNSAKEVLFIEWAVETTKRGGEAFWTVEDALDWLERSTAGAATPRYTTTGHDQPLLA